MRQNGKDKAFAQAGKGTASYSGWLVKRGGFNKGWKKRWFTFRKARMTRMENGTLAVRKPSIQYFLSPENAKAKGKILLEDVIDITPATNYDNVDDLDVAAYSGVSLRGAKYKFAFNIITAERTYYVSAEFADDLVQWLTILYTAPKVRRQLTKNVLSLYLPRRPKHVVYNLKKKKKLKL